MKLQFEEIKGIIHNCLNISEDENGIHLNRFTDKQYRVFEEEYINWIIRAKASAGVTIDFVSDTKYFAMEFLFKEGSSRDFGCFDVYIDDTFTIHKRFVIDDNYLGFNLDGNKHRITIYFPWSFETIIKEINLSNGCLIERINKNKKILCLGDSITQGYIAEYPSLTYPSRTSRELDVEIVNQGIGGYYFNDLSLDEKLKDYAFDLISVAYGTNDFVRNKSQKTYISNIKLYIKKLTCLFDKDILLGIIPICRSENDYHTNVRNMYWEYNFEKSRDILRSIYNENNIKTLDQKSFPMAVDMFAIDGVHPNDLGFSFYANEYKRTVKNILKI